MWIIFRPIFLINNLTTVIVIVLCAYRAARSHGADFCGLASTVATPMEKGATSRWRRARFPQPHAPSGRTWGCSHPCIIRAQGGSDGRACRLPPCRGCRRCAAPRSYAPPCAPLFLVTSGTMPSNEPRMTDFFRARQHRGPAADRAARISGPVVSSVPIEKKVFEPFVARLPRGSRLRAQSSLCIMNRGKGIG